MADMEPDTPGSPDGPRCPRCGATLVIRKWRKPPHSGKLFWGCPRYRERKCSYTRDLLPGETPPPKPAPKRQGESRA